MSEAFEWDCFIAYPSGSAELARALSEKLRGRLSVFFDNEVVELGAVWSEVLAEGLSKSLVTLVLVSRESSEAHYEQEEIARAIQLSRRPGSITRVVPILCDGLDNGDPSIPYGLQALHGMRMSGISDASDVARRIIQLVRGLRKSVDGETDAAAKVLAPSIREHLRKLKLEVEKLTQDQYRVINQMQAFRRLRIKGSAGSGKTLVAAEKSIRLAGAGCRVLFLCHNPLLAEHVRALTSGSGVNVCDFLSWVRALSRTQESGHDDWRQYDEPVPEVLAQAMGILVSGTDRYDAIVVDEGQDFRDEWWVVVEAALRDPPNGHFYVFHDNNQSVLARQTSYPIQGPGVDLSRNCRNAGRVLELMRFFDASTPEPEVGLRDRGRVTFTQCGGSSEEEKTALRDVIRSLSADDLLSETVVITASDAPLADMDIARCHFEIMPRCEPWQDRLRSVFNDILTKHDRRGVQDAPGGRRGVIERLRRLSTSSLPTLDDIQLVRSIAESFRISRIVKNKIESNPRFRTAFSWRLEGEKLALRRPRGAPIWSAELLLHFVRDDWNKGLPEPRHVALCPYYDARDSAALPVYRVVDFKGLEADSVVLLMRGCTIKHREAAYVGLSRARSLLNIVADRVAAATLPKMFRWDRWDPSSS